MLRPIVDVKPGAGGLYRKVWVRYGECGHEQLLDETAGPVPTCPGSSMSCPVCSRVAWAEMRHGIRYRLYYSVSPFDATILLFVKFLSTGRALFKILGGDRAKEYVYVSQENLSEIRSV